MKIQWQIEGGKNSVEKDLWFFTSQKKYRLFFKRVEVLHFLNNSQLGTVVYGICSLKLNPLFSFMYKIVKLAL